MRLAIYGQKIRVGSHLIGLSTPFSSKRYSYLISLKGLTRLFPFT